MLDTTASSLNKIDLEMKYFGNISDKTNNYINNDESNPGYNLISIIS